MSDSADAASTPMMKQYLGMRRELPADVLLMFRLGDFYELFFEDAKIVAETLKLTLTKRNGIPMCGVPHHAVQGYIARLIRAGKRVAMGEQTSDPIPGKLVQRELSQIISAGTVTEHSYLDSARPNYIAAVFRTAKKLGLAIVDHTTGQFEVMEFTEMHELIDELERVQPSELLHSDEDKDLLPLLHSPRNALSVEGYYFLHDQAIHSLTQHYKVQSLDGFGCASHHASVCAAGAILQYLQFQLRRSVEHLRPLRVAQAGECVLIDAASQSHLELVNSRSGKEHTLLSALDRTATPMGARKLRHWVLHPLRDVEIISHRQDYIGHLMERPMMLNQLRTLLKEVRDIERNAGRLSQGSGNGRDMQALALSLEGVPSVRAILEEESPDTALARQLYDQLHDLTHVVKEIQTAIVDEPPATLKDGNLIRLGYNPDLDELKSASTEGRQWIADLQNQEIERTGIKSLKIKYNAVFGYFIEITKSNLGSVPEHYRRKQTTATGERYITEELKRMEDKILGAEERSKGLEYEVFVSLRGRVLEHLSQIQATAEALALLDVLCALSETARLFNYVRPVVNESRHLHLRDSRHPVLDQTLTGGERFVPNDVTLEPEANRLLLITGPNMAGKSTYLRQVALLTIMAQIGSWVPAGSAEVGLVDRIFTRIGASDDIARGQSTFMVEMTETALILNNATERSLVILDEIGRGTSTFDGLSIAWSVAEHLHDQIGSRTLFATHYHELTALSVSRSAVQNYNVAVKEWNQQIIFLRKIIPGSAEKSYGIQVARLAGLPDKVIQRAREVLAELESGHAPAASVKEVPEASSVPAAAAKKRKLPREDDRQLQLFG
jgi:DNA mismatch repair protein MutS